MRCVSKHTSCDRRVPFCKNCKSTSDCVYWKKGTFSTQKGALRAYRASLLPATKEGPTTASSLKPPGTANKLEVSRPQPNTMIKDIEFLDGDISHSQKRCPSSIIKLIGRNLVEFDKRIASGLWSANRTCYVDRERESLYVNPKTDREVLVARYRYGGSHQFFVVWLPGRDPSDVLEPAVCKFRVYNNDGHVIRNGKSWLPLVWKSTYTTVLGCDFR